MSLLFDVFVVTLFVVNLTNFDQARQVEDALKSGHPALQESEEKSEAGQ